MQFMENHTESKNRMLVWVEWLSVYRLFTLGTEWLARSCHWLLCPASQEGYTLYLSGLEKDLDSKFR